MSESDEAIHTRPVTPADLSATRRMRLEALRDHPEAFGSDYHDLLAAPSSWEEGLRDASDGENACFVVAESGGELVGMAGVFRERGAKVNHQAVIWSVYVRPACRGRRVADRLIGALIDWCRRRGLRSVRLSATTSNAAAIRCYQRLGFSVYGVQPEVIRVGDVYHDELLMWRRVDR